jgi:hypothetical protein
MPLRAVLNASRVLTNVTMDAIVAVISNSAARIELARPMRLACLKRCERATETQDKTINKDVKM